MSFLKGVVDYIGSIFSETSSIHDSPQNRSHEGASTMDSVNGVPVSNERYASKFKGYFNLSQEEIAKAVRAEEWGIIDDAILHYQNANRILTEASSTAVPSFISSSEQEKVKSYRQKISKWQSQVSDRLATLSIRAGVTSSNKSSLNHVQRAGNASKMPNKKPVLRSSSHSGANNSITRSQPANVGTSQSTREVPDGYDPKLVEMINTAIVDRSPSVKWDDIAGLQKAKQALLEMVILPTKRRDLFTGLRKPARGLLLFGPPGNGKTMLAKAVASESEATFFNLSAASFTSKWLGESEKLVRTLFMVAKSRQPSVIFMDEIDSVMSSRHAGEHEASRRLKSEFLVQFDGVTSNSTDLVIVIGATNKPQELDDAVLRRLVKRIYIPLPDENGRRLLLKHNLKGQSYSLPTRDLERLVKQTEGYSGSDLQALCEEAAMMPIRELGGNILTVKADQIRSLKYEDFQEAMKVIRPSLSKSSWKELEEWNQSFGSN
ncbi:hypothetical protein IC582_012317 [Cucumis melo]|uniref:microtubule-severing ATPase n=2 Tax=Cucumis melo TaxID=3656 RepID=A0A1S3AVR3_CUCME|nr:uncharacterized protein LOC103483336 [Cucumis melo]TYK17546.1 spastin isoform X1 [Cucumis melo var. makuwa]